MYCLQWLLPLLLIPKPPNFALLTNSVIFMILYIVSFFLERKPCTICTVVFAIAVILMCQSGLGNCLFFAVCDGSKTWNSQKQSKSSYSEKFARLEFSPVCWDIIQPVGATNSSSLLASEKSDVHSNVASILCNIFQWYVLLSCNAN